MLGFRKNIYGEEMTQEEVVCGKRIWTYYVTGYEVLQNNFK